MIHHLPPSAEEIDPVQGRGWTRFPPDDPQAWIILKDQRTSATIIDESFGGVCVTVAMADSINLRVGDPLIVLHQDYPTRGRVQWIQRDEGAKQIRLGVGWSS